MKPVFKLCFNTVRQWTSSDIIVVFAYSAINASFRLLKFSLLLLVFLVGGDGGFNFFSRIENICRFSEK